jgi:hypothetical protein
MARAVVALVFAAVLCSARTSTAEELRKPSEEEPGLSFSPSLDGSYFWDDGAIPFIYGSATLAIGLRIFCGASGVTTALLS